MSALSVVLAAISGDRPEAARDVRPWMRARHSDRPHGSDHAHKSDLFRPKMPTRACEEQAQSATCVPNRIKQFRASAPVAAGLV